MIKITLEDLETMKSSGFQIPLDQDIKAATKCFGEHIIMLEATKNIMVSVENELCSVRFTFNYDSSIWNTLKSLISAITTVSDTVRNVQRQES